MNSSRLDLPVVVVCTLAIECGGPHVIVTEEKAHFDMCTRQIMRTKWTRRSTNKELVYELIY